MMQAIISTNWYVPAEYVKYIQAILYFSSHFKKLIATGF